MKYEKVTELFINGKRQGSSSGEIRNVLHPADGHLVATFHEGGAADTVSAIDAARNTFDGTHWPSFSGEQRGKILEQVAEILERDKELFAQAESEDTAKRIVEARYDIDDVQNSVVIKYCDVYSFTDFSSQGLGDSSGS